MHRFVICCIGVLILAITATVSAERIVVEHFLAAGHGEAVQSATEQIIELFHQVQDEIEVQLTVVPGDYTEPILTRIIAGTPPDVITTSRVADLLSQMLPLDQYVGFDDRFQEFVPPAVEQSTFEGKVVQIPIEISPLMTFYNKILFDEAGLEDPNSLYRAGAWDWDAVATAGQRIARSRGDDGILDIWGANITAFSFERNHMWIHQAGGQYFDQLDLPSGSRIHSPEVAAAFEFINSLIYEKRVMEVEAATSWAGYGKFIDGEVGMNFEGPWMIGQIRYTGVLSDDDWDVAPPPKGPANDHTMTHTNGLQILKGSANPDAAYKWIMFFATDPRALEIYGRLTGRPSAYLPQLHNFQSMVAPEGRPPHVHTIVDTLLRGASPFMIQSPLADQLEAVFEPEIIKYFNGEQSIGATLQIIDEQWEAIFREARSDE